MLTGISDNTGAKAASSSDLTFRSGGRKVNGFFLIKPLVKSALRVKKQCVFGEKTQVFCHNVCCQARVTSRDNSRVIALFFASPVCNNQGTSVDKSINLIQHKVFVVVRVTWQSGKMLDLGLYIKGSSMNIWRVASSKRTLFQKDNPLFNNI